MRICDIFASTPLLLITLNAILSFPGQLSHKLLRPGCAEARKCCCCCCCLVAAQPPMAKLIMTMMTYLSYYSFSARGRATRRRIPSDGEFISAGDENELSGPGLCTACDLCSLKHSVRSDSGSARLARRKSPCFAGTGLSAPHAQTVPPLSTSCSPARPPPPISQRPRAANRWPNIWVLSESRIMPG